MKNKNLLTHGIQKREYTDEALTVAIGLAVVIGYLLGKVL